MRATFITTALENCTQLEDVQKAAGHRDPSTTKLYDQLQPGEGGEFFCDILTAITPSLSAGVIRGIGKLIGVAVVG
jgi:hypothetical protein